MRGRSWPLSQSRHHRQARWALFFTPFQFTVAYRPGSKNTKADALSRQFELTLQPISPDPILPTTLIVAPVQWDVLTEIVEMQGKDSIPTECPPNKTFVPPSLRTRVNRFMIFPVLDIRE